jgi:ribosomal protein L21E
VDSVEDQARRKTPYHPACNSAVETFNKILKHYIATALVDAEASTLDWEAYLAALLFAYNTAVSSSTKVTPFEATFGYDPRVLLWQGVEYPGDEIVERKDFAEYLAEVKHTQLRTRQIAHHNNQQVRLEYKDKYDVANKVVYPKYVAGDQVWVKVKDKNQRSANPKLAPIGERGTVVERSITGTSYRVDRPGRKRKKVITVNVQQLKPYRVQEERTGIARPPPVPPGEDEQQQSTDEHESEGEEEEYDMPEVDLGTKEEESKEADPHFLETMRERLAVLKDTPLPQQDTPLPVEQTHCQETIHRCQTPRHNRKGC